MFGWWKKLSIRLQLMILLVALLSVIELGTLYLVHWFDAKERKILATELAQNLLHSLNQDLLRALISNNTDSFSDISFRISGYPSVRSLLVLDQQDQPVFVFGDQLLELSMDKLKQLKNAQLFQTDSGLLLVKAPIKADGFQYGSSVIAIDARIFKTKKEQHIETLLLIFPVQLFIGFLLSLSISKRFTRPFHHLAQTIKKNNISQNRYYTLDSTDEQNEIRVLFDGYNHMVTQIQEQTQKLHYISEHDSLTGLLNRYAIEKKIQQALNGQGGAQHVLLNFDLDQFKLVNDSLGHDAGDALLKMIAQSGLQKLPHDAYLARTGGDDFMILLMDTDTTQGWQFAQVLQQALHDFRFFWQEQAMSISGTIGMVTFQPHQYTLQELLKVVDIAFYTAKRMGVNQLYQYQPDAIQNQQYHDEIEIARYLKEALQQGPSRFELYAQAIVPLQYQGDQFAYEVLIRMFDSVGNFLPPDKFLPTAQRYQLMVDIDIFVLKTYLQTVLKYPEHITRLASAHINLAGDTLNNPRFQQFVRDTIKGYDFPWHKLELELTETSAVGNFAAAQHFIEYCQSHNIGFALDDFGTGMASFEYLKNLPFDIVKIDGSFIKGMHTDAVDHAMIRYTQDISRLKGQKTIAEYVETEQDVQELKKIGIDFGQGYFLGKPKPLSEWINGV